MTEEKIRERQVSDSLLVGILLALTGGFLDAYSYLVRGEVFANAQTGNMVLLGIYLSKGQWVKALYYLVPIFSFVVGVVIAQLVKNNYKESTRIHWRQIVIAVELVVLLIVAFIPQGYNMIANVSISFVCSMQVQSFRKVNGNPFATTMCTGNLRSATEHLCNYHKEKDIALLKKSLQYYLIIAVFIAGAITGCLLSGILQEKSILICCAVLFLVLLLMCRRDNLTIND